MNNNSRFFSALAVTSLIVTFTNSTAWADDETGTTSGHRCVNIDWSKLDLTATQAQQIQQLKDDWNRDYNELQPTIMEEQHKLVKLLQDHNSDPVEIMSLQQSIARKKEQLHAIATANYLKKRQLLNENQQHNLEQMMRQMLAQTQRRMSPIQEENGQQDHIQDLIHRVRSIWPTQQEH